MGQSLYNIIPIVDLKDPSIQKRSEESQTDV